MPAVMERNEEVLIYCPKCSRQIVTLKSKLGDNMLCPHCGYPFVAKLPKRYSENKAQLVKIISVLSLIVACGIGKWAGPEFLRLISPQSQEKESYQLSMNLIEEYGVHLREYRQTVCNSGVLEIYISETGRELNGEVDQKKYRRGIETSLKAAKRLNAWCKDKKESFDIGQFKGRAETAGKMILGVYGAYYELTTIGIRLFSKTLEHHRVCCGSQKGASKDDVDAYKAFYARTKNRDIYGRESKDSNTNFAIELKISREIVYKLAQEYAELEAKKTAEIQSIAQELRKIGNYK